MTARDTLSDRLMTLGSEPIPAHAYRNFYREPHYVPIALAECRLRASLREKVHGEIACTFQPRGRRGLGFTDPSILRRIRWARIQHSESVRRQRADAEAAWRSAPVLAAAE